MKEYFFAILGGIALGIGLAVIMSIPTMLLWNWLMPIIFNLPKINFLQALGLNVLTAILFKNNSGNKDN